MALSEFCSVRQGAKGSQVAKRCRPIHRSTGQDTIPKRNPGLAGDVYSQVDLVSIWLVLSTVGVVALLAPGDCVFIGKQGRTVVSAL